MTKSQITRTLAARTETIELLNKELAYLPQHQKRDRIEFYRSHIAKLDQMLGAGR